MSDELDRAQQCEEENTARALNQYRLSRPEEPEQLVVGGVVLCIDCDEPVQPARLQARPHASRCICCQQRWEQEHR